MSAIQKQKLYRWRTFFSNWRPLSFVGFLNKNLACEVHEFLYTTNTNNHQLQQQKSIYS